MKNIILVLVVSVILFSCKDVVNGTKDGLKDGAIKSAGEYAKEQGVKLHVFSGGDLTANKLDLFSQDTTYQGQSKKFAISYYVLEHPKGNLIWDAGLPENLIALEKPFTDPSGAFTISRKDSLVNQLKSIGLVVKDFKYIALSHIHFDHIGHANYFKDATWFVQENEYNFIKSDEAKTKHADLVAMIKDLKNPKKLNGDYDIYGDGTAIIKYAPGHTIGHQTLYLNIGLEKPVILIGDLYHFEENRTHRRVPIFNHDKEETLKSMEIIEKFAKEKGAEIIIQHSPKDFKKLTKMISEKKK